MILLPLSYPKCCRGSNHAHFNGQLGSWWTRGLQTSADIIMSAASEAISCKRQNPPRYRTDGFPDPIIVYKTGFVGGAVGDEWNMSQLPPCSAHFLKEACHSTANIPHPANPMHLRKWDVNAELFTVEHFLYRVGNLCTLYFKNSTSDPCQPNPICDYLNGKNLSGKSGGVASLAIIWTPCNYELI